MIRPADPRALSPAFEHLLACVGSWNGTNRLWITPGKPPAESSTQLSVTAVVGQRFLRLEQTWSHEGHPQEGSLLIGCEPGSGLVTGVWIDSFHMNRQMMVCTGHLSTHAVVMRGTYASTGVSRGDESAWGWSIFVAAVPGVEVSITMYNIPPHGREEIAVKATFALAE